jgi:hypothetical protein
MGAGFGMMESNHVEFKVEMATIVWQVRVLLGGASLVRIILGYWRDLGNSIFHQIAPCFVVE